MKKDLKNSGGARLDRALNRFMRLFVMTLSLCGLSLTASAQSGLTTYSALLTVTNAANTNYAVSVNGVLRVFTNPVFNFAAQVQVDTNQTIAGTTSNLYTAYLMAQQLQVRVTVPNTTNTVLVTNGATVYTNNTLTPSTNELLFQGFPGVAMTVTLISNWATVAYSSYGPTPTNYNPLPIPSTGIAPKEQTNDLNGLIGWLNLNVSTNQITATNPIWDQFTSQSNLASLSNFTTNAFQNLSNYVTNSFHSLSNTMTNSFANESNYMTNTFAGVTNYISNGLTSLSNFTTNLIGPTTNWSNGTVTFTNWTNVNGNGEVWVSVATNLTIYDQNSNVWVGPITVTNQEFNMPNQWFETNSSNIMSFHGLNARP